jgi:hypothetical protein
LKCKFTSEREFGFFLKVLKLIPISKKKVPKKKKRDCDERHRLKKLINLLGW